MRHVTKIVPERELTVICLLLGFGLGLLLVSKIQALVVPQVRPLAVEQVQMLTRRSLQTALTAAAADSLTDALTFQKDREGRIAAVNTDVGALSAVQHKMLTAVYETVEQLDFSVLRIPARGFPQITMPVREVKLVQANAVFRNELSDAGTNQTRHSTILEVTAQVDIHMPTFFVSTTVEMEVTVFETLIVGFVPRYYGESS